MRRPIDPVADLRSTVATLQIALDRSTARIRELESIASAANARAAEAVELADAVQMQELMRERAQASTDAMQSNREVSP